MENKNAWQEIFKKYISRKKWLRFLIIGLTSTILDFFVYCFFSVFMNINISKLISMMISCSYSYILNRKWTFNYKRDVFWSFFKYILSQLINIFSNVGMNCVAYLYLNEKIASFFIATIFSSSINYIMQKNFVFKIRRVK